MTAVGVLGMAGFRALTGGDEGGAGLLDLVFFGAMVAGGVVGAVRAPDPREGLRWGIC